MSKCEYNDQPIFRQYSVSVHPKNFRKPGFLMFSGCVDYTQN